ncbi:MAG: hypothetical protein R3E08_05275 [Thiotrichaceae bacterium]
MLVVPLENSNIVNLAEKISTFPELYELLQQAIIETPPILIVTSGVLAMGYDVQNWMNYAISVNMQIISC